MKNFTLIALWAFLFPLSSFAANGDTFTVEVPLNGTNKVTMTFKIISEQDKTCQVGDGSSISISINSNTIGSIEIPAIVNGYSVTGIGFIAFYSCTGLTTITIPNSVTSIGGSAFSGCTGLTSITIPNSVTSIGGEAFQGTGWFDSQPDGLVYAGKVAYKYKGTMLEGTSIVIEERTMGIAGSAFEGCTGLTTVTIPNSVTSIGHGAFEGCI